MLDLEADADTGLGFGRRVAVVYHISSEKSPRFMRHEVTSYDAMIDQPEHVLAPGYDRWDLGNFWTPKNRTSGANLVLMNEVLNLFR